MMMMKMIMIIMWENFNSKLCFKIIVSGKRIFFIPSDKILIYILMMLYYFYICSAVLY